MNKLKYLIVTMMAFAISGCGQDVTTTLQNPVGASMNGPGTGRSIVVLPFADYSEGDIASAQRRSMLIAESFADKLNACGFSMPIGEDVFAWLVKEGVINLAGDNTADTSSLDNEIGNSDWSDTMRSEIVRYREKVKEDTAKAAASTPGVHSLTKARLAKLGRHFKADYVVRGRILEFKTRDEARWEPWKKGVLPFVYGGTNRILNGFANSEDYDARNEGFAGAFMGGLLTHKNAHWPWKGDRTILGMTNGSANTITWMLASYAYGSQVTHNSRMEQAVVQMRVWVQEAASGNVVWTNRIRVAVAPESVLADRQYDLLFNKAIEKAVTTLTKNFVEYGL